MQKVQLECTACKTNDEVYDCTFQGIISENTFNIDLIVGNQNKLILARLGVSWTIYVNRVDCGTMEHSPLDRICCSCWPPKLKSTYKGKGVKTPAAEVDEMIDYLADQRQQIVKFTQFSLVFSLVLSDLKFKRNEKLRLNPVRETLSW